MTSAATPRPPPGPLGATDPARWRLDAADKGRHAWHYARDSGAQGYEEVWGEDSSGIRQQEQSEETKYWAGLDLPSVEGLADPQGDPFKAAKKGFEFYKRIQSRDGHWAGGERRLLEREVAEARADGDPSLEYGGPLFLLPGIVIAMYVTKTPFPEEWKIEIAR